MRRLIAPALLAAALAAAACSETLTQDRFPERGMMSGTFDGQPWQGTAEVLARGDTILLFSSSHGAAERHLAIVALPQPTGQYRLLTGLSRYTETVGGDVLTYQAPATAGTVSFANTRQAPGRTRGEVQLTVTGARGTSTFSGTFEAAD